MDIYNKKGCEFKYSLSASDIIDSFTNMTIKQIEGYSIYMNKLLGKGSYGSVYIGRKEQTN